MIQAYVGTAQNIVKEMKLIIFRPLRHTPKDKREDLYETNNNLIVASLLQLTPYFTMSHSLNLIEDSRSPEGARFFDGHLPTPFYFSYL